jgi:hypothetical protein
VSRRFFLFTAVTVAAIVVVVANDVGLVVHHDVGAAAGAQLAGAVASAGAGLVLVLDGLDDQPLAGLRQNVEEDESSKDQDCHQSSKLPGQRD